MIQQGYATGPAEIVVGSMTVTSPVVAVVYGFVNVGTIRGLLRDRLREGLATDPRNAAPADRIDPMANGAALHEDNRMMSVFSGDRR